MKVLEHVVEGLVRQGVEINEMQCDFMSGLAHLMHQSFVSTPLPPPPPTGMGGDNDFSLFKALV